MIDCGILRQAISLVDPNEDQDIVDCALNLVYWLTFNYNTNAIQQLLAILTNQKDNYCYSFFKQITQKVQVAVDIIIRQITDSNRRVNYETVSLFDETKER